MSLVDAIEQVSNDDAIEIARRLAREEVGALARHMNWGGGAAKFWLTPRVDLAVNMGLSPMQIRQAQAVVVAHISEIEDAWRRHFGG